MKLAFLDLLECPYCGDGFRLDNAVFVESEVISGTLVCGCDRFPIIAAIPVILKGLSERVRATVSCRPDSEAILEMMLSEQADPFWLRASRVLGRQPGLRALGTSVTHLLERRRANRLANLVETGGANSDLLKLMVGLTGNPEFGFYLYYKLGQPRHLTALAMGEVIDTGTGPVLDVGCGPGQITGYLQARAGGHSVIGCDRSFSLLYIARHWVAPYADYVCCDVESPLPFKDRQFATITSFDAFHHVRNKLRLVQEFARVGTAASLCCLGSVRNALAEHDFHDEFITPDLFARLAGARPYRLVSDAAILERYLQGHGPDLSSSESMVSLRRAELMTLVLADTPERLKAYGAFGVWPHARGVLGPNPLYTVTAETGDRVHLRLRFPSAHYEIENRACLRYMPETAELSTEVYRLLQAQSVEYGEQEELDALAMRYVALGTSHTDLRAGWG